MAIETTIKPAETRHVENVVSPSTSTVSAQERLEHSGPTGTMPQPDEKITGKLILAFVALLFQLICYETTYYVSAPIVSVVVADLGYDPSYTWILNSWSLCAALVVSIAGRLGDIFGRRYFMLAGGTLAILGSIVGATGQSIGQMIVSGALFGLSAGILENYYACLMELVPYKKRTLFIGLGATLGFPCLLSPIIACAIVDASGWRAAYWYICGVSCLATALCFLFYHPPSFETKYHGTRAKLELIQQFDFVGLLLFTAAGVLSLVGLNFGGKRYPWSSANTLVPLTLGFSLWFVFGVWECFTKSKLPFMPLRLFKQFRSFTVVCVVCFISGMFFYSLPVLWPQQSAQLFLPANATIMRGVYACVPNLGTWLSGMSVALICSRLNHGRWQIVFCFVVQIALAASMGSLGIDDKTRAIVTVIFLLSFVNQPMYLSFTIISLGIEDQADIGIAAGAVSTIRLMGGAIGVAVYSTILADTETARLKTNIAEVVKSANLPSSDLSKLVKAATLNTAAAYKAVPGISASFVSMCRLAVKHAYLHAFSIVWYCALAFGCLALVSALFLKSIPTELKTGERAVHLENEQKVSVLSEEKIMDLV